MTGRPKWDVRVEGTNTIPVPEAEILVMAEIFAVLLRGGDARVMMRAPLARSFVARMLRAKQRGFIDSIPTAASIRDARSETGE